MEGWQKLDALKREGKDREAFLLWKKESLWYILRAREWAKSKYRREREYAGYVKRFYFGDGEITFDGNNETWQMRKKALELPMPTNVYLYM